MERTRWQRLRTLFLRLGALGALHLRARASTYNKAPCYDLLGKVVEGQSSLKIFDLNAKLS